MQSTHSRIAAIGLSTLAATALLAACDRAGEPRSAGQSVDSVLAQTERKIDKAADKTASMGKDMAITAELKAQLAKDEKLSAMSINVDTNGGQVTLRGTAPDPAARERATAMARGISGVTGVDNQLTVQ
jgi:hyperosmotically inducible periplasmic protein